MAGPILESKSMRAKNVLKGQKRAEYLKILVKMYKILWKRAGVCVRLLSAINC